MPYHACSPARVANRVIFRGPRMFISVGLACAASSLGLLAQQQKSPEDETVTLNPFTVNAKQDKGYRASNSVTGSKVETPIMDIPMASRRSPKTSSRT